MRTPYNRIYDILYSDFYSDTNITKLFYAVINGYASLILRHKTEKN